MSERMVRSSHVEWGATSCWPPSMSYVAPVSAVLVMMCTARAATSAGAHADAPTAGAPDEEQRARRSHVDRAETGDGERHRSPPDQPPAAITARSTFSA